MSGHDTQSSNRSYLGTIGVVMVAWIAGLVWASIAFFDWLVS